MIVMLVYHVTTKSHLKNIRRVGLIPTHTKNVPISKQVNYVFTDKLEAGFFASEMEWKREEPVVIITFDVPKSWLSQDTNTRAVYGKWMFVARALRSSQIKRIEDFDAKFKASHRERMDRAFSR